MQPWVSSVINESWSHDHQLIRLFYLVGNVLDVHSAMCNLEVSGMKLLAPLLWRSN